MSKTYIPDRRGIVPVAIIAVIAVLVLGLGAVAFLIVRKTSAPSSSKAPGAPRTAAEQLDALSIEAPRFEAPSASVLPALEATALNVSSPSLPGSGIFKDFSANTDASYSYILDIPMPEVKLTIPEITATTSTGDTGSTGGSTGGAGSEVNAANCAQFASMPSAQYCSQVSDPNGKSLCEQCKAAGF